MIYFDDVTEKNMKEQTLRQVLTKYIYIPKICVKQNVNC